ncbi:cobalt-zinc-cadmium resistance protein CzcB [Oxobacter pfennigii]|uniref:Cobalt-zinc-cadmium resistance protein CzcB n=1 Tax=Oxobacter pfennigii TaxID=36849 RepID=A0A0P8WMQ5_9CLOT|nr:HlyD family efflux transporter periplasmic adaptor subunit [Oxobacter pfennigii]KPU43793.1 cobalt-zinc-cadmium resistance protein CzcB [Oxobacter pfennigii]
MKNKKLWILIIGMVFIACLAFIAFSNQGAEVPVTDVKRGDIKRYVEDIGTVKCKELKTVSIEGSGLIQNVAAGVGQQVKKGELLLSMERNQLEIQLKNVDEKIKEIKAGFEGNDIKNYASSVEKARIAVGRSKDAYESALEDFNKVKILAEAGAASNAELKQKEEALKSAEALMRTAELNLQQIEANTPDSVTTVYKAQLEQAVLSRESMLHNLEKQEVVSPIDGVILERHVDVNTVGMPGTVAFVIGDISRIEIEADILADEVSNIQPEDEVEITERSEQKHTIGGKVVKIAPGAVAVTSSLGVNQKRVAVTIEPAGQSELLRPGYDVDVKVITQRKNGVVLVPLSSVFDYNGKDCVFTVSDGKAVLTTVQKGIQDEEYAEIIDGLKEGDMVLTAPDINTKEGMRIKPEKSS